MLREHLKAGCIVCYTSSEPLEAVTATGTGVTAQDGSTFEKGQSEIELGDVVVCQVQPRGQYYAHLVLGIDDQLQQPVKYTIGNMNGRVNGYCYENHIFCIRACSFDPIQAPIWAVTAEDRSTFVKRKFVIELGDVVFCKPQAAGQDYADLVVEIEYQLQQPVKYIIGNIKGHVNGYCYEKHIFGIRVDVQMWHEDGYISRPFVKTMYHDVKK